MFCPRILVACTPKSGSTFLSRFLAYYFDAPLTNLVPAHGCRHQEIETSLIPISGPFVAQNHVVWSEHTENLSREFGFKIVVLSRNLFDSFVSLREHFINESTVGPLLSIDESFAQQNASEQLELIVSMATPWYLNFFASYSRRGYHVHSYDELFSSDRHIRFGALQKLVCSIATDSDHSEDSINYALLQAESEFNRRNIGLPGRGNIISELQRKWVEKLAKQLDSSVDFRRIGLFGNPGDDCESTLVSNLTPIERYELEYLRARNNKVEYRLREFARIVGEKQAFIDSQREYIDRLQQLLEKRFLLDTA